LFRWAAIDFAPGKVRREGRLLAGAGLVLVITACAGGWSQLSMADVHAAAKGDKKAGEELFHSSGCEHCHGADARGTDRAPDLSTVGKKLSEEQIERQIRDGGISMPAFGDALQPDQIKDLVAFLHEKKKTPRGNH
jgi:mono/diheme cytochrome c family protein